jgi:putative ABC transport system permease protein
MSAISYKLLRKYPPYTQGGAPELFRERFQAIPLRDAVIGDVRPALYMLMGAVGFLLAISCANTATLLLARASRRTREMAVRLAAGAQRKQILCQLLTEAVLLSIGGAIGTLLFGQLGVRALLAISPADLPRIGANSSAIALDWRVFLFTLLFQFLSGSYAD